MDSYALKTFGKLLKTGYFDVRKDLDRDTNVMRVYERVLNSLDFSVDIYAKFVLVTDYSECEYNEEDKKQIIDTIASNLYVAKTNVFFKKRIKGQEYKSLYAEPVFTEVKEAGLLFKTELVQKTDTGFFIDNYRARLLVRELSQGADVLNLFCYTGAYSVNAAAGGAKSVTSVDTSHSALAAAEENMALNNFKGEPFYFVRSDAGEYLRTAEKKKFDLIIFDAPSFSNGHGGRRETFDIQKDHVEYLNLCHNVLKRDGIIIFRTNLSSFKLDSDNLKNFRIRTYTAEMTAPGFTKKSQKVKTFALRALQQRKIYYKKGGNRNGFVR